MNHFFYNLISFFNAAFFIILGLFCIVLPWSPSLQTSIIYFLMEQPLIFALFGAVLMLIGGGIAVYLFLILRHYSYRIISSKNPVDIDQKVIEGAFTQYWKELFPNQTIAHHINFSKHKILMEADLPYVQEKDQKAILKKIDQDIAQLLHEIIGYQKEYLISLNFQSESLSEQTQRKS